MSMATNRKANEGKIGELCTTWRLQSEILNESKDDLKRENVCSGPLIQQTHKTHCDAVVIETFLAYFKLEFDAE